jgi:hypothetical protein
VKDLAHARCHIRERAVQTIMPQTSHKLYCSASKKIKPIFRKLPNGIIAPSKKWLGPVHRTSRYKPRKQKANQMNTMNHVRSSQTELIQEVSQAPLLDGSLPFFPLLSKDLRRLLLREGARGSLSESDVFSCETDRASEGACPCEVETFARGLLSVD